MYIMKIMNHLVKVGQRAISGETLLAKKITWNSLKIILKLFLIKKQE